MTSTSLNQINEFLDQKRIAIIGVSRNPQDFSRTLFEEFKRRNYEVIPVNPNVSEVEGITCYGHVQEIQPPVDGVLIMTTPQIAEEVVKDCHAAGVRRVWLHRGAGVGAVSPKAIEYCHQNNIEVIEGYCPFMFFSETAFFHRLHGFGKKLTGSYPH
jgi:predicted CoA-binding protein